MEQRNIVFICLDTVRKDYFDKFSKRIKRLSDIDFLMRRMQPVLGVLFESRDNANRTITQ